MATMGYEYTWKNKFDNPKHATVNGCSTVTVKYHIVKEDGGLQQHRKSQNNESATHKTYYQIIRDTVPEVYPE